MSIEIESAEYVSEGTDQVMCVNVNFIYKSIRISALSDWSNNTWRSLISSKHYRRYRKKLGCLLTR